MLKIVNHHEEENRLLTESSPGCAQPDCVQSPFRGEAEISDLTRFLARRELINVGLTKFDDHPENYWAWNHLF